MQIIIFHILQFTFYQQKLAYVILLGPNHLLTKIYKNSLSGFCFKASQTNIFQIPARIFIQNDLFPIRMNLNPLLIRVCILNNQRVCVLNLLLLQHRRILSAHFVEHTIINSSYLSSAHLNRHRIKY